jgi:hypothetical protein
MTDFDHGRYEAEVRERWSDTDAYRESTHRTKSYTPADWAQIKGEGEAIEAGLADAMRSGDAPESERALGLAEAAREHIDRWFYPCSHAAHAALAEMYTSDARFAEHYDKRAEGLAAYVSAAIKANAARQA